MTDLTIDQAKQVYRVAIDANASDAEGAFWWSDVVKEVREVCSSESVSVAASVIEWWHSDWSAVGDSAIAAAQRLRKSAKTL